MWLAKLQRKFFELSPGEREDKLSSKEMYALALLGCSRKKAWQAHVSGDGCGSSTWNLGKPEVL